MMRRPSRTQRGFLIGGLVVALLLALVVSGFASSSPDGLERVAEDKGFLETARDHAFSGGPLADYTVRGVGNERLSTGLSGVIGVLVTFAVGAGVFALFRRRSGARDDARDGARGGGDRADAGSRRSGGPGRPDRG
jgi:cobalt/nickel transport protein